MNASGYIRSFIGAALVLAAGSARANAQARSYTVCKDGTTWLVRGHGVCGGHGGVDPRRSELANRTLNPNWPKRVEEARRHEFEDRMKAERRALDERQRLEREALNSQQRTERQSLEAQKKSVEANEKFERKNIEANDKAAKKAAEENEKAIKKAQKLARKP